MHYHIIMSLVTNKLNNTFARDGYPPELASVLINRVMIDFDRRMADRLSPNGDMSAHHVAISLAWRDGDLDIRFHDGSNILERSAGVEMITRYDYDHRTIPVAREQLKANVSWLDIAEGGRLYGDEIIELVPGETATTIQRRAHAHFRDHVRGEKLAVYVRKFYHGGGSLAMVDVYGLRTLRTFASRIDRETRELARASIMSGRAPLVEPVKTHDTSASFAKFMAAHRIESRDATIDQLNVPDHGTLSSRTWGIEVESGGARGVDAPDYWDRKYDGSLESAYGDDCDHDYYTSCECEEADNDEDCAEFVSPVLRSVHSRGLEKVTGELADNPQNDTAGVHVHVGASDLTPKQIGGLVFAYQLIEPMLEPMYQRETREYCRTRPLDDVAKILKSGKTAGSNQMALYTGDRYHSVNLQSLSSHTTIEFRAMGPVYDYEYLIRWAYFCREMVNVAKANVPVKRWTSVKTFADVIRIFEEYGSETSQGASLALIDTPTHREVLSVSAYETVGV